MARDGSNERPPVQLGVCTVSTTSSILSLFVNTPSRILYGEDRPRAGIQRPQSNRVHELSCPNKGHCDINIHCVSAAERTASSC
jgi:hypothetical protein